MMDEHETQLSQELTHRQQMEDQHSPLTTGVAAVSVAFVIAASAAGYKNPSHMLSDIYTKVVTAVFAKSNAKKEPMQAFVPK